MIIVLDASAAAAIALKRPEAATLTTTIGDARRVISPTLFFSEVSNVYAKYVKGGFISKQAAIDLLKLTLGLVDEFYNPVQYATEAMTEAIRLNHSAYDMYYLLLARRTGASLMSLDQKLQLTAPKDGVEIISN